MAIPGIPVEKFQEPEPKIHKRANSKLKRLRSIIGTFAQCFFYKIPKISVDIFVVRNNVNIKFTLKGENVFRPSEGLPTADEIKAFEPALKESLNDIFLNQETQMFYDLVGLNLGYMKPDAEFKDTSDHPTFMIYGRFGQIKRVSKKNFKKIEARLEKELVFLKIMQ